MNTIQTQGQQDASMNVLSPEAKEFVPRHFHGPGSESGAGDGLDKFLSVQDASLLGQRAVNNIPQYLTTCYPFVPVSGEHRYGRPRYRGKAPQMLVPPQYQALQAGSPRVRFPPPGKNIQQPPASWAPGMSDICGPFQNAPNGMPFDGGTGYQNGLMHNVGMHPVVRQVYPSMYGGSSVTKEMQGGATARVNGLKDSSSSLQVTKSGTKVVSLEHKEQVCLKNTAIQTDFPAHLANSTLEDIPNTLYNPARPYTQRTKHKNHSRAANHTSNIDTDSDSEHSKRRPLQRNKCVSNGTDPVLDFTTVSVGNNKSMQYTSVIQGRSRLKEGSGGGGGGVASAANTHSMQEGYKAVPSNSCNTSVTLSSVPSYAAVAQSKPSQNRKPKNVESNTSAATKEKESRKGSEQKSVSGTGKKVTKPGTGSRLGSIDVNVAQLMADLDRAGTLKTSLSNDNNSNSNNASRFTSSTHHNEPVLSQNQSSETLGQSYKSSTSSPSPLNYSAMVKKSTNVTNHDMGQPGSYPGHNMAGTTAKGSSRLQPALTSSGSKALGGQGQVWGQKVEVQGQSVSDNIHAKHSQVNGTGISQGQKSPRSRSRDSNCATAEGNVTMATNVGQTAEGEVKKKRRRRRRRKKKTGGEDGESCGGSGDEVTLHFEDDEEFPDLASAGATNQNGGTSGSSVFSYSAALKNTTPSVPVDVSAHPSQTPTPCLVDEYLTKEALLNSEGDVAKESRNSRKRRKRREVANKAADAEMAEINLEQQMLELKMKQKMPLSNRKSVSPQHNASTQGVWKLPPTSPTPPSSTGKKVSLLLPGTVATETSHSTSLPTPSTATKQHGILKTSQPVAQSNASSKKSKQPITYSLGALIDALETKKEQPVPVKKEVSKPLVVKKDDSKPHNILDSSAPIKRGKEREVPKSKKPSPLKKVILKEREEKKRLRLLDDDDTSTSNTQPPLTPAPFPTSPVSAPVGIGVLGEDSDLSQDASSTKGSLEVGLGTPASAELSPISQQSPSCMSPMSPGASPISSGLNSPITGTISQTVKLKIHSRRFREYCNQVLDKEIDNSVTALLTDLVRFQDKQYHKDPIKAKSKRRFVLGLREVTKHLKLKKIKCVIISPNLEKIQSKGGLDDALNLILELCNDQSLPFIFALGRRALGRACAKLVPVSVVGIFNYEGSEVNFRNLVSLTEKAREAYREMISQIEKEIAEYPIRNSAPGIPTLFSHMGHSRTPSGCSVISFTSSILSEPISENYPQSEPETDNRGYEIETKPDGTDVGDLVAVAMDQQDIGNVGDVVNDVGDPYEADDESNSRSLTGRKCTGKQLVKSSRQGCDRKVVCGSGDAVSRCSGCETCGKVQTRTEVSGSGVAGNSPGDSRVTTAGAAVTSESTEKCDSSAGVDNGGDLLDLDEGHTEVQGEQHDEGSSSFEEDFEDDENVDGGNDDEDDDDEEEEDIDNGKRKENEAKVDEAEVNTEDKELSSDEESDEEESEDSGDDEDLKAEDGDRVVDLPHFIESVHHFDLNEILSQHSSKTMENAEDVMSTHSSKTTHSSRTLGEAVAISVERPPSAGKMMEMKNSEFSANVGKGKSCIDKENRTLSWVKEAQTLHFTDQVTGERDEEFTVNGVVSIDKSDVFDK